MIFIDLENKLPTDEDLPDKVRWTQAAWQAWLDESKRLVAKLDQLNTACNIEERNKLIDKHSDHWGKLKPWLLALSDGKCWFSGVKELYSHYDVEHFRPKKAAKALDGTERDGYWWLAFDYMNFRICGNVGNRKKGGWFPLKEGSLCSSYTSQCEESETPYLLDPIDITDVSLIAFDDEGKAISMPSASPWEQARVAETVKRLKLNEHTPLTEARRKTWQQVNALINEYSITKNRCAGGHNPAAKEKLKAVMKQIQVYTAADAELSAVARCCVLLRNDDRLTRLIG